jgi:hypothetical protein
MPWKIPFSFKHFTQSILLSLIISLILFTDLNISDEEEYLLGEIETPEGHRVEEIIKDSINVTPSILTRCDQPIIKPNKYSPTLLNK